MNPFKYGSVVTGEYFFDRINEIKKIKNDLKGGNNLILYAPRRYGKTSLITKTLFELENEGFTTIYLDFFNVISKNKFVELYARTILNKNKSAWKKAIQTFRKFVNNIIPSVTFDETGSPSFKFTFQSGTEENKMIEDIINLPEKYANPKNPWIIVFDEFQEINNFNGETFEKQIRSAIQFHKNVSYVFMGSKTHLLLNMFRDKSRAFYNIGKLVKLNKISENDVKHYLIEKFSINNIKLNNILAEYIIQLTENIPYYIQFLASEIWQKVVDGKKEINKNIIDLSTNDILSNHSDYYLEVFDKLSLYQKNVLLALTRSGKQVLSKDFAENNNLSSTSTTQRAIKRLVNTGIIDKENEQYVFSDPFFKRFIQLRFTA